MEPIEFIVAASRTRRTLPFGMKVNESVLVCDRDDVFAVSFRQTRNGKMKESFMAASEEGADRYMDFVRKRMVERFEFVYQDIVRHMNHYDINILTMNPHIEARTKKDFFAEFLHRRGYSKDAGDDAAEGVYGKGMPSGKKYMCISGNAKNGDNYYLWSVFDADTFARNREYLRSRLQDCRAKLS
ncbi:MAG: hypothetical protein HY364_00970 [Candidatus Aenigmarchaeota archaeon]|nr:hypothetical protein [Candidatus Aenigmarchaeota archaeon]